MSVSSTLTGLLYDLENLLLQWRKNGIVEFASTYSTQFQYCQIYSILYQNCNAAQKYTHPPKSQSALEYSEVTYETCGSTVFALLDTLKVTIK